MGVIEQPSTYLPFHDPEPARQSVKAVFLDRDGVINVNRADHVKTWDEFQFLPGVPEAMARLAIAGLKTFIVTNQAVINRGIVSRETIDDINFKMVHELESRGGRVEAVAFCPHRPDEKCGCRKPEPGLLLGLASRHELELCQCVMIGDAINDVEAGLAAGCRAILVLTGRGADQLAMARQSGRSGFQVARDLSEAVDSLVNHHNPFASSLGPW